MAKRIKEEPNPHISNKQYQSAKRSLKRKEKDNYSRIYLILCSGDKGWYEMAENSALIYYYEVVKRFGLKNRFFEDALSFYEPYKIGYIRIRSLDDTREWLKKAGMYESEGRDSQRTVYFELKVPISEKQMNRYLEMEKARRVEGMSIMPAHNLSPEMYQLLIGVGQKIHNIMNSRLDRLSADTIGTDVVRLVDKVLERYHHITYFKPSEKARILEKWKEIRIDLYDMITKVKVMADYKLLHYDVCININEVLHRIVKIVEENMEELTKPKKKTTKQEEAVKQEKAAEK